MIALSVFSILDGGNAAYPWRCVSISNCFILLNDSSPSPWSFSHVYTLVTMGPKAQGIPADLQISLSVSLSFSSLVICPVNFITLALQFHLLNLGRLPGSACVPRPCSVAWKLLLDSRREQSKVSLFLFLLSQRIYCPALMDVQCLKRAGYIFCSSV